MYVEQKKAFQARRKRIVLEQGSSAFGLGIMGMEGDHRKGKGTGQELGLLMFAPWS
jgi:hypothetical protein